MLMVTINTDSDVYIRLCFHNYKSVNIFWLWTSPLKTSCVSTRGNHKLHRPQKREEYIQGTQESKYTQNYFNWEEHETSLVSDPFTRHYYSALQVNRQQSLHMHGYTDTMTNQPTQNDLTLRWVRLPATQLDGATQQRNTYVAFKRPLTSFLV